MTALTLPPQWGTVGLPPHLSEVCALVALL